jgi:hypothetical protein
LFLLNHPLRLCSIVTIYPLLFNSHCLLTSLVHPNNPVPSSLFLSVSGPALPFCTAFCLYTLNTDTYRPRARAWPDCSVTLRNINTRSHAVYMTTSLTYTYMYQPFTPASRQAGQVTACMVHSIICNTRGGGSFQTILLVCT